jgi:hypothetical protein
VRTADKHTSWRNAWARQSTNKPTRGQETLTSYHHMLPVYMLMC